MTEYRVKSCGGERKIDQAWASLDVALVVGTSSTSCGACGDLCSARQ